MGLKNLSYNLNPALVPELGKDAESYECPNCKSELFSGSKAPAKPSMAISFCPHCTSVHKKWYDEGGLLVVVNSSDKNSEPLSDLTNAAKELLGL